MKIPSYIYFLVIIVIGIVAVIFLKNQQKDKLTQQETQIVDLAVSVGMDRTQFETDFKSQEVKDLVASERAEVLSIISSPSTPTIFINGVKTDPADFDTLSGKIQNALDARTDTTKPVVMIQYTDFNCSACKAFDPISYQLLEKYGADLKLVHQDLPFLKDSSYTYAYAAEAARRQGKFDEMNANLFKLAQGSTYEFDTVMAIINKGFHTSDDLTVNPTDTNY